MIPNNVAVVDTETTGMEPTDEVIEFGVVSPVFHFDQMFGASRPIPAEVSAIHHISNDDVAGLPLFRDHAPLIRDDLHRAGVRVLVAHNAAFDSKMMGEEFADFEWICTYKVALHLWNDAPNHKNETLCYHLGIGARGRKVRTGMAHSAYFDASQTAQILRAALAAGASIDQMIQWTKDVKNITKLSFGKHAGKTWAEIDSGYLNWMVKNMEDEDLIELASRELRRRR